MLKLPDLFPYDLTVVKEVDSPRYKELYVRASAALVVAVLLWVFLGITEFLLWFAAYFSWLIVHVALVQMMPQKVGLKGLAVVFVSAVISSLIYGVAILILWSFPEAIYKLIAIAMTGLAMLNIGLARRQDVLLLSTEILAVGAGVLLMPAWLIWGEGRQAEGIALLAVLLLVFGYFVWGITDMTQTRQRLAASIAEDAEREKVLALGRLTGGVAHDFNNMLTVISGNTELLALAETDAEREELRREIQEAASRAAAITSQLLDFTRQGPLTLSDVLVLELLEGLLRVMRRLMPEGVEIIDAVSDDLPRVRSDAGKLETTILNACLNARDAMNGMGRITIGAKAVALVEPERLSSGQILRSGRYVQLDIIDTGPGIPKTVERTIFEPFFTTKLVGQGSGLGLSMAKGFLEQTRGGIEVKSVWSDDGRITGARASLWLPVVETRDV